MCMESLCLQEFSSVHRIINFRTILISESENERRRKRNLALANRNRIMSGSMKELSTPSISTAQVSPMHLK